jgi:polar amino acid transport system substrate-binding protein
MGNSQEFMAMREILAPNGKLRVGVFAGSPLSMATDSKTGEIHGVCVDLGKELAQRLLVPFEPVNYQNIAGVLAGMKAGDVDFTLSNATPARAAHVAFSPTLLSVELGYLVPATSLIAALGGIDKTGVRMGVTQGSTSQSTLPKILPNATIVPAQNFGHAVELFRRGELNAFATNKPTLFEMSGQMPGSRILDGQWGIEHIAIAIPKGRETAMEYLRRFVEEVQTSGLLAQAVERASLRGVLKAQ